MTANYHTHTYRCNHADGDVGDYAAVAAERGVRVLGFSDHTPYFYPAGMPDNEFAMHPSEIGDYVSSVLKVREEYRGRMEIALGFETEYFPRYFDRLIEEYSKYPIDYIILGEHYSGAPSDDGVFDTFHPTEDKSRLITYTNLVEEAVDTGRFSYIAHPEVMHYVGDDTGLLRQCYRRIIRAAKAAGIPVEFNLYGMVDGRHYPAPLFWEEVAAEGSVDVILGCDAHTPGRVADPDEVARAEKILSGYGITPITRLTLINPVTKEKTYPEM